MIKDISNFDIIQLSHLFFFRDLVSIHAYIQSLHFFVIASSLFFFFPQNVLDLEEAKTFTRTVKYANTLEPIIN